MRKSNLLYKSNKSDRIFMNRSLRLEDLEVYKIAVEIAEIVWNIVMKWEL